MTVSMKLILGIALPIVSARPNPVVDGDSVVLQVEKEKFKYMVAMGFGYYYPRGDYVGCGGSIIALDKVLTARHCIPNVWEFNDTNRQVTHYSNHIPTEVQFYAGINDLSEVDDCIPMKNTSCPAQYHYMHPAKCGPGTANPDCQRATSSVFKYNENRDIAVYILDFPFNATNLVGTIPIPTDQQVAIANIGALSSKPVLTLSGWGFINPEQTYVAHATVGTHSVSPLQYAHLIEMPCSPLINSVLNYYAQLYNYTTLFDDTLCAAGNGTAANSCPGDSGGPLALHLGGAAEYLVGVVSYGYNCTGPAGFVNLKGQGVRDWVNGVLNGTI
jgi:hypothetical protein